VRHRNFPFLSVTVMAAFLSLASGPLAFGQQTTRAEVVFWHARSPLRLHVVWVENNYSVKLNGDEILSNEPGDFGAVDEWVKLDPILKVGENTPTFYGVHRPTATHRADSWRFDVFLEGTGTGPWSALKDYSAKGSDTRGSSVPDLQHKLTLKIAVSE
jgi:hypothetical protein